jgi:hypothetical protein
MSTEAVKECPCKGLLYKPTEDERIVLAEVAVMTRLLKADQCEPWTRAELERSIGGDMLDISDALVKLNGAGLINLTEQFVTVSRAARRSAELAEMF